ncbi:hypothetical protein PFICI_04573 [Pestalotiopsis fici W106-1]|uniref:Heterokaryon incompatibility domain-containing protein n=1 Tax=Pestalotiopsis fici (strain W106-1 / CGMCC3.15140) TaxID=1229662 RepID=W3XB72_PESFW|nr:uncharacterized protein PFICI_04573 [Pestalotiopsis fici W106-1]ETS82697.1 hypothetical protein PFICI_04573 [Pestalotiopsis fici W106-1]
MDARLDGHFDLDKPSQSGDPFQIIWPEKLPQCHGVCERTEDSFGGGRRIILSDEVQQDAERGCPKCMIIFHSCRDLETTGAKLEVDCHADKPGMVRLSLTWPEKPTSYHTVQVYVELGTPEPSWKYIKPRRILTTKRRVEYKPLLHSWIEKCNESHTDCIKTNPELPHIVLDVGSQDKPRLFLHVSFKQVGQYTALSYCWGRSNPPKTTTLNIEQHKRYINFDELPKCFQDAITVTRDLGIRYLWIDSLCIQQDDTQEWQKESSKMADYYNHAYLVIAASQAGDPSQGFLDSLQDSSNTTKYSGIHIGDIINPDSSISRIYREKLSLDYWWERHADPLDHSPLNRRAWVFQEYLLAKRIVHFTANELLWECVEDLECECLETKNSAWDGIGTVGIMRKNRFLSIGQLYKDSTRLQHWLGVLSQYSTLSITKGSDVLPALSGLAKFWRSPETGEYLAGFWEKNIIESIGWIRSDDQDGPKRALQRSKEKHRPPSWSPFSIQEADRYHNPRLLIPVWISSAVRKKYVVVYEAVVTTAGEDETGEVESGYLKLKGPVTRVDIGPQEEHVMESKIELGGMSVKVQWDIEMDLSRGLHIALLLIYDEPARLRALVLKACGCVYERVGILFVNWGIGYNGKDFKSISKLLQAGTKEVITII